MWTCILEELLSLLLLPEHTHMRNPGTSTVDSQLPDGDRSQLASKSWKLSHESPHRKRRQTSVTLNKQCKDISLQPKLLTINNTCTLKGTSFGGLISLVERNCCFAFVTSVCASFTATYGKGNFKQLSVPSSPALSLPVPIYVKIKKLLARDVHSWCGVVCGFRREAQKLILQLSCLKSDHFCLCYFTFMLLP